MKQKKLMLRLMINTLLYNSKGDEDILIKQYLKKILKIFL